MSDNNIYLVDGSSLAFRSFFALITSGLRRGDGMATWAIIGFFNSLFELIEKRQPHRMAVSFDLSEPTFRHQEFKDYKAHRAKMPDDLAVQWPIIKEGVKLLGIPLYEVSGYEADDVIGTVSKLAEQREMKVIILTGDQDSFQLLDDSIQVLYPSTKDGLQLYGRQEVFNKLGVWPEQVIDYKGLVGDTSDNIPGVRGIGPKTAVQLLSEYTTLEGVYENVESITSNSVKNKLITGKESAFLSKHLATIRLDVPVDFDFDDCKLSMPDLDAVVGYFRSVESSSILRRLPRILKAFNDGLEPFIDPELLQPVGKPARGARVAFKKPPAAVGAPVAVGAVAEAAGVASGGGGGQLDLFASARGGVAVAEQQKLELTVTAKTAAVRVGELNPPLPDIVRTEEQLHGLVATLGQQQLIALEILKDTLDACEGCITGYALAWCDGAELGADLKPSLPSLKDAQVHTAYIPVMHKGDAQQQLSADTVLQALKPVLENERIGKISSNGKVEINVLSLLGVNYGPLVFDPILASYVVNPDISHKMREQAQRFFGYTLPAITDIVGTGKKQVTWDYLPVVTAASYAADAARLSLMLCGAYMPQLDEDQKELLYEMDLPLSAVLGKMEATGIKIDVPYFREFSVLLTGDLATLEKEIFEHAGHSFNINSPLQLQQVLFKELKLPTKGKTKSGYSTDHAVLEALAAEHPIVSKILEFRHLSKLNSTYVESLPKQVAPRDGRLHGEFNQTSTATGRLSSTNPNLQNIPIRTEIGSRIRKGFVPADDQHVLLSADYSQIELRLLAHMSGDEGLIEAFRNDEDIHTRTAINIFDVAPDAVTSDHRRVGKTLNFALIYQQGAFATAQSLGISTREAQAFIEKYFAAFPKVRQFMQGVIEEARRTSYVQTLWGRRRYFQNLNDRNDPVRKADERAACNAPLQGSAADLIKLAMIKLDKELTKRNLKSRLVLQVHDELVLDVPATEVEEMKSLVRECMSLDQPLLVPLRVDIGVGKNWMDTK